MAIVFGRRSGYLASKRLAAAVSVVSILGFLLFLFLFSSSVDLGKLGLWGAAGMIAVLLIGTGTIRTLEKKFNRIDNGMQGEAAVSRELKKLPDEFVVFRGVLVKQRLDVDCIVVGPTGVFSIEAKSHKGEVGYDGRGLTRNGRLFEKDFFREAAVEAKGLRDLVRTAAKYDVYVEPVIVFSRAKVRLGPQKINGSYVIGKARLNELLTGGSRPFVGRTILVIAKALAVFVNDDDKNEKIDKLTKTINNMAL